MLEEIQRALLCMNILLIEKQTVPKPEDIKPKVVRRVAFSSYSSVYKA